jgi:hypothetical protein
MMKTSVALFLSLLILSPSYGQVTGIIKKSGEKINRTLHKLWADWDPSFKLQLLDLDIIDGISLGARYYYEVYPAYRGKLFQRVDRYETRLDISALDILGRTSPLYLGIDKGTEVFFVRNFESKSKAARQPPVPFWKLPLTSEGALDKDFRVGDVVSIPTHLYFAIGAQDTLSSGVLGPTPYIKYVIGGQFDLQVIKIAESKVKVRLISHQKKTFSIGAALRMAPEIEIFKVSAIDGLLERTFETTLAEIGWQDEEGDIYIIDYDIDLSKPEGAQAYNELVQSNLKLNKYLVNPGDQSIWTNNMAFVDHLFYQEAAREDDPKKRAVHRSFKGRNEYDGRKKNWGLDLVFYRRSVQNTYTKNSLSYFSEDNTVERALYFFQSRTKQKSKLISGNREWKTRAHYLLINADEKGAPSRDGFSDYGLRVEYLDRKFVKEEQQAILGELNQNLPKDLLSHFPGIDQFISEDPQRNARVIYRILLKNKIISYLKKYSLADLRILFPTFLQSKGVKVPSLRSLNKTTKLLYDIFQSHGDQTTIDEPEALKLAKKFLTRHKSSESFKKAGIGFIISLIPEADYKDNIYVSLFWTSDKFKDEKITFGTDPSSNIYKALINIQTIIERRTFDLNLVGYNDF